MAVVSGCEAVLTVYSSRMEHTAANPPTNETVMKHFNPHASQAERAVQVWQILVAQAMDRKSITYEQLSVLMFGRAAAGVLGMILGHVANYCNANGLPPLTVIVVNSVTGLPGESIPVDAAELNSRREAVYKFDWYDIYPPSDHELSEAFQ